jgi:hypothetical protein
MVAVNASTMNNNITNQTELTLDSTPVRPARRPHPVRPARAAWWFARMHDIVDNAIPAGARNSFRPSHQPSTLPAPTAIAA